MGFTNLVDFTSILPDTLSRRRLPGIDVGHDTDVTRLLKRKFTSISHD